MIQDFVSQRFDRFKGLPRRDGVYQHIAVNTDEML